MKVDAIDFRIYLHDFQQIMRALYFHNHLVLTIALHTAWQTEKKESGLKRLKPGDYLRKEIQQ